MSKSLLMFLILTTSAFAQEATDEALILNQELTFLEEAANGVTVVSTAPEEAPKSDIEAPSQSLEDEFFGSQDSVSARAAAPNRPKVMRRRE